MRINTFTLILSFILLGTFIFQTGCEERTTRYERLDPEWFNQPVWQQIRSSSVRPADVRAPVTNTVQNNQNNRTPKINFASMSHDFGRIRSGSNNNICEFVFTNAGNDNLIISSLKTSCDCTKALLEGQKMEYAPGESGKILAAYYDTDLGESIKHIYLNSNDPENPRTELAIKAELFAPIDIEPKKLNLSLVEENANCPKITIRSLDNQPFSITGFQSNDNCITAKFYPNEKKTSFILEPKVDMEKLRAAPEGVFKINLSHPDCQVVSGSFYTPPRFSISPRRLIVNNADPSKTVVKTINITSYYNEDFDVRPLVSSKGIINIRETQRTRNGYMVTVEINPPVSKNDAKMFSDNINISLAGIGSFTIPCNGYYPGAIIPESEDEECKTCGPVRLDKPELSKHPR